MSIKLLPRAIEKLKYLHTDHLSNQLSIGFICYGAAGSELMYEVLENSNNYLSHNGYTEFLLFTIEKDIPIVNPLYAKYTITELDTYKGIMVALDLPSWQASLLSPSNQRYLYAYEVGRYIQLPKNVINDINNSEAIIISRTENHKHILKSAGFKNVSKICMKYFDVEELMDIIND
jgi:hypothetical protein